MLQRASKAGIGLIGMKAVRYLAPHWSLGKGDPSAFDSVYGEKLRLSSFSPFQRAYAYVLQHGLDVVNADMQNFKFLEENIIAAVPFGAWTGIVLGTITAAVTTAHKNRQQVEPTQETAT